MFNAAAISSAANVIAVSRNERNFIFNFQRDRLNVIWSYGTDDPDVQTGLVPYHGETTRGSISLLLLEADMIPPTYPPPDTFLIPLKNHDVSHFLHHT